MPPKKQQGKSRSLFDFLKPVQSDGDSMTSDAILVALKSVFGHGNFRPMQKEIIESLMLQHRDCLCILPTGAGKSLLYQLPAVAYGKGIALVVSPLIALMKDQVDALQKKGIAAEALHSQQTAVKTRQILQDVSYPAGPKTRLLFVTPEYLTTDKSYGLVTNLVKNGHLKYFAIDESHCISEWGNSFRASFLKLGMLKTRYPDIPIIALTATATPRVRDDIQRILKLNNPKVFVSTFNRPEISYSVRYKDALNSVGVTTDQDITQYCKMHAQQTGIVYARKREDCDRLAEMLKEEKLAAASFHSGLKKNEKIDVQEGFQSGKYKVIVCTIAFGMGIDKADVRYVLHYELSKSLEAFSQESGRAARDGAPAESIVYYSPQDKDRIEFLIGMEHKNSKPEVTEEQQRKFSEMVKYCESTEKCRRRMILEYFGEHPKNDICTKHCDICAYPDLVRAEVAKAIGTRSQFSFDARRVRSLLPPDTGDLRNNDFTNPTLKLREDSPPPLSGVGMRKVTKKSSFLQRQQQSDKEEMKHVARRANINESDSIDAMFAKLEEDERRFNPTFARSFVAPREVAPPTTRRVVSKTGTIGFVPASLLVKRKATTPAGDGPSNKKRKVSQPPQNNLMTRYLQK